jgi:hypothetical protein
MEIAMSKKKKKIPSGHQAAPHCIYAFHLYGAVQVVTFISTLFTRSKWVPEIKKMLQRQNLVGTPQSGETYRHRVVRLLNRELTIPAYHHRMLTEPAILQLLGASTKDKDLPQWLGKDAKLSEYRNLLTSFGLDSFLLTDIILSPSY